MMSGLWENVSEAERCNNTIRPLIHSLDLTKEGLGMKPTRNCSVDGCNRAMRTRGMCQSHYGKLRRSDEFETLPIRSVEDRLKSRLIETANGCQEWTGTTDRKGYGQIGVDGKRFKAHRLAWELANGPIPTGLSVLHHCDNPPCCQTDPTEGYPAGHLFVGTSADNTADMIAKGRYHVQAHKSHCPQGHVYSPENTYTRPRGGRSCRTCNKVNLKKSRQKLRDLVAVV